MHRSFWALSGKEIGKKIHEFEGISTSGHRALLLEWLCCYKQLNDHICLNRFQTLGSSWNRTVILERRNTSKSDLCDIHYFLKLVFWVIVQERDQNKSWVTSTSWRARVRWKEVEKDQCVGKRLGRRQLQTQVQITIMRSSWIFTLLFICTWIGKHSMKRLG